MSNVYSDVNCAEEQMACDEDIEVKHGVVTAVVVLRCLYTDRWALVADILGQQRPYPKYGDVGIPPRAARASIRPTPSRGTGAAQRIDPLDALVTVTYTTELQDSVTESIEPTTEFVTLDNRFFTWASGTGDLVLPEEAPGFLRRGINFVRNEMFVTTLDDELFDLIGTVNESNIVSELLGRTFAPETLLFAPPTISHKRDITGAIQLDVTKKWTYQPQGWNKYYRAKDNAYQEIFVAGTASPFKSYEPADHSGIYA